MTKKIIIITTPDLHNHFASALERIQSSYTFEIHEYMDFRHLASLYANLEDKAEGFLISGSVAKRVIELSYNTMKKPLVSVQIDLANIYRMLLNLKIENRDLDMSRIAFDYLLKIDDRFSVLELLSESDSISEVSEKFEQWLSKASLEDLLHVEDEIITKIRKLWLEQKLDLVINFFSSIYPRLRMQEVSCFLAYPRFENILNAVISVQHRIKINELSANLPLVISMSPQKAHDPLVDEWNRISLHKQLLDFKYNEIADYLIQQENDGLSIITNTQSSDDIVKFEQHHLEQYLSGCLDFKVVIGYGVGNTVMQAKRNATNAKKEALAHGKSFLVDENNRLIGPLGSNTTLTVPNEVSPSIQDLAKRAHLSTLTIQKLNSILALLGSQEITSSDITTHMGVTIRNANRILGNLEANNLAIVTHEKSAQTKGRPQKVYKVLF